MSDGLNHGELIEGIEAVKLQVGLRPVAVSVEDPVGWSGSGIGAIDSGQAIGGIVEVAFVALGIVPFADGLSIASAVPSVVVIEKDCSFAVFGDEANQAADSVVAIEEGIGGAVGIGFLEEAIAQIVVYANESGGI